MNFLSRYILAMFYVIFIFKVIIYISYNKICNSFYIKSTSWYLFIKKWLITTWFFFCRYELCGLQLDLYVGMPVCLTNKVFAFKNVYYSTEWSKFPGNCITAATRVVTCDYIC